MSGGGYAWPPPHHHPPLGGEREPHSFKNVGKKNTHTVTVVLVFGKNIFAYIMLNIKLQQLREK